MIHVHDLFKEHAGEPVLRGVSLAVSRGEVAVIVGPSGGGKSTLLRCINGLEPFQSGRVNVNGLTLEAGPSHPTALLTRLRRTVGMVFQQFNLFPHMSVLDNVLAGPIHVLGQGSAEAEPRARDLLDRVGLADKAAAFPGNLSGGQQQRVAIARALAVNPLAILFDEPTSALDPRTSGEVLKVIADLASAGQTMMVVTHAMEFARKVADTVHVMDAGAVAESGPPGRIFDNPQTEAAKRFLQQVSEEV